MRIYGYLRASTKEQDAERAKDALEAFAAEKGLAVDAWFVESVSGATLKRPELFRLLDVARRGDVLLVEQVDRISRLDARDWERLKAAIADKGVRIIALDLPTSHQMARGGDDDFSERMLDAINAMLLDMLAATARKDYDDRRRRQSEGIRRAKAEGKYRGRRHDPELHAAIRKMLSDGWSYTQIQRVLKCSRSTISAVKKSAA